MAREEAKVRVRLDTKQAKQQLKGIVKEGQATAGRVGDQAARGTGISGSLGRGFGVGAAAGIGFGLARRLGGAAGAGGVFSESTVGLRALVDEKLGGPEARANRRAREGLKEVFAPRSGGEIGPNERAMVSQMKKLFLPDERGRNKIDQEFGGIVRPDGSGPFDKVIETIKSGFESLKEAIGGGSGR